MIELFIVFILAIIMETVDSGLGLLYGTILSPLLIISGYNPFLVVPAILLSQALGGFMATYSHNKYKNAIWHPKSDDFKISSMIIGLGIIAVIIGAYIGTSLPKLWLNTYIGIICTLMGGLVLTRIRFKFSLKKILLIGGISAFNKALSGGGFGPLVATGNMASGIEEKKSIGITDFAEAPICVMSFFAWVYFNGWPISNILLPLCTGALIGGVVGPYALSKVKSRRLIRMLVGILALVSGLFMLYKVWI